MDDRHTAGYAKTIMINSAKNKEINNSSIDAPLEEIIVPRIMFMGKNTYAPHDQNKEEGFCSFIYITTLYFCIIPHTHKFFYLHQKSYIKDGYVKRRHQLHANAVLFLGQSIIKSLPFSDTLHCHSSHGSTPPASPCL